MLIFRALVTDEVQFTLIVRQDESSVLGAFGRGIDAIPKETQVFWRLHRGDTWAWAAVKLSATWKSFSVDESLGQCSYADEKAFRTSGDFLALRTRALIALNERVKRAAEDITSHIGNSVLSRMRKR